METPTIMTNLCCGPRGIFLTLSNAKKGDEWQQMLELARKLPLTGIDDNMSLRAMNVPESFGKDVGPHISIASSVSRDITGRPDFEVHGSATLMQRAQNFASLPIQLNFEQGKPYFLLGQQENDHCTNGAVSVVWMGAMQGSDKGDQTDLRYVVDRVRGLLGLGPLSLEFSVHHDPVQTRTQGWQPRSVSSKAEQLAHGRHSAPAVNRSVMREAVSSI